MTPATARQALCTAADIQRSAQPDVAVGIHVTPSTACQALCTAADMQRSAQADVAVGIHATPPQDVRHLMQQQACNGVLSLMQQHASV